jgi:hypothetical protein
MRKLSLDEMMFGMVEGKQYTLRYEDGGIAYQTDEFVEYFYNSIQQYCVKFNKRAWVLYSVRYGIFDRWWTVEGRYFTTED